jgi:hypothetical protein
MSHQAVPGIQQNNEQILNDIQSLQQMERQLFTSLETTPHMSAEQQQKIVEKMNELSNMRINLYKTLSGVNNYFDQALQSSIGSLREQVVAVGIVENELNKSKQNLQRLEEERNNKIRMVEINSYFGDKYSEHAQLMKVVIYTLIPVIILVLLHRTEVLPSFLYNSLLVVVAAIGGYYFWERYSSIIMRDNMNYQEYTWYFDPSKAVGERDSTVTGDPWASADIGICVGDSCCSDGMTYDTNLNQCVSPCTGGPSASASASASASSIASAITATKKSTNKSATPNIESMLTITEVLTKTQPGKFKADYDLRQLVAFNA